MFAIGLLIFVDVFNNMPNSNSQNYEQIACKYQICIIYCSLNLATALEMGVKQKQLSFFHQLSFLFVLSNIYQDNESQRHLVKQICFVYKKVQCWFERNAEICPEYKEVWCWFKTSTEICPEYKKVWCWFFNMFRSFCLFELKQLQVKTISVCCIQTDGLSEAY